jgi:hypothetical protein
VAGVSAEFVFGEIEVHGRKMAPPPPPIKRTRD